MNELGSSRPKVYRFEKSDLALTPDENSGPKDMQRSFFDFLIASDSKRIWVSKILQTSNFDIDHRITEYDPISFVNDPLIFGECEDKSMFLTIDVNSIFYFLASKGYCKHEDSLGIERIKKYYGDRIFLSLLQALYNPLVKSWVYSGHDWDVVEIVIKNDI